jgi:hypothetical protein
MSFVRSCTFFVKACDLLSSPHFGISPTVSCLKVSVENPQKITLYPSSQCSLLSNQWWCLEAIGLILPQNITSRTVQYCTVQHIYDVLSTELLDRRYRFSAGCGARRMQIAANTHAAREMEFFYTEGLNVTKGELYTLD